MITYSLNWMGPINTKWIRENGDHWAGGRIDIDATEDNPYGLEYSVPTMHIGDWIRLGAWLRSYYTEEVVSFETIINEYEKYHTPIQWFKSKCE